ncbi:MAG: DUF4160 domain-containing protein [Saprospiraceae bacterium]|nr:DUF4160 domain-containing protein [Saprospiraceae bacterium]MBK7736744.1 DUF4160 domain-containing protein [Saprospiraceae bacterium]MBK7911893.1 DUF4160 domain-containing protein [Saprospiraceae bacterium]
MPEISRFFGIIIKMYYNEHNPPHFHVEYQDFTAVISIEDGMVKGEMPRKQLNLIFEWLDLHKSELIYNWELSQLRKSLNKIEPLKDEL